MPKVKLHRSDPDLVTPPNWRAEDPLFADWLDALESGSAERMRAAGDALGLPKWAWTII